MNLKQHIGTRVRGARRRQRLTQQQLAERIEKSVETVSNIERGHSWPSLETMEELATALRCPVAEFVEGYGGQPPISPTEGRLRTDLALAAEALEDADLVIAVHLLRGLAAARRILGSNR